MNHMFPESMLNRRAKRLSASQGKDCSLKSLKFCFLLEQKCSRTRSSIFTAPTRSVLTPTRS
jgi:hypothetical protein